MVIAFIMKKLRVLITKTSHWYNEGDIHDVQNYITFGYLGGKPFFEKNNEQFGIDMDHCRVLKPVALAGIVEAINIMSKQEIINAIQILHKVYVSMIETDNEKEATVILEKIISFVNLL